MIHETAKIHPSAIIEDGAVIGANVTVGPFSYIGTDVTIGEGTEVLSHVVIKGPTTIGEDNRIFQFASIGEECQDLKYKGEPTRLEIGDRNVIRESVSMHRGTTQDKGLTKVGSDNLFMINVHVAHDCEIGNRCILANNVTLAGHVKVEDFAILGGMSAVHQFCRIGKHSMVGGASGVAQDVPPFVIAQGNHATPYGVNYEGLKRRGFDKDEIHAIRRAYKSIYRNKNTVEEAKVEMTEDSNAYASVKALSDFISTSARGIIR